MSTPQSHPSPWPSLSGDTGLAPATAGLPSADGDRPPRIEGYQLRERIGVGAMGTVWRALQLSTRREVAVKLMSGAAFQHPRVRARFEREIELSGRLNHQGIVTIYHSGLHEHLYFFAMELIPGLALNQFVAQRQLTLTQKLVLMEQICDAVQCAHQQGVIHRDLKPSNILVTDDGRPHVLDFGLAKAKSDEGAAAAATGADAREEVSIDGGVIGTMAYMAPEQAAGRASQAGAAADVYSLGVILYQMLTGQLPHTLSGSMFDQQRQVIEVEPVRPRKLNPRISSELEAVLLKALAKSPGARYATAGELGDDLKRYREGEPLRARPLTVGYVMRKRLVKHRGKVALLATLVLIALIGAGAYHVRVRQERNRAERAADEATRALYHNRITMAQTHLDAGRVASALDQLDLCPPAMRHWEWRRLRLLADQSQSTLDLQAARAVTGLRAEDGALVAINLYTMQLQAWTLTAYLQTKTGQLHPPLALLQPGAPAPINASAYLSPDGTLVALATDQRVRIVSTRDGATSQTITFDDFKPRRVCFSVDNRSLFTVTQTQISCWDVATAGLRWSRPVDDFVSALAGDRSGRVAMGVGDHVSILAGDTGQPLFVLEGDSPLEHLDWSDDGRQLVVADRDGCSVWDAASQARVHRMALENRRPNVVQFSADARLIAIADQTGSIGLWDAMSGAAIKTLRGHRGSVHWLAFTPDDRHLVSRSYSGEVKTWDLAQPAEGMLHLALPDSTQLINMASLPSGRQFLFSTDDGRVHRWDPLNGEHTPLLDQPGTHLPMAPAPDGQRLATGNSSGTVQVWDLATRQPVQTAQHHDLPVHEVIWSPCGRWIVSIGEGDGALVVADAATLSTLATWPRHRSVAFTSAGDRLVSYDPTARTLGIWHTGTWQQDATLPDSAGYSLHATISPDNRWLAASGQDIVGVWDLTTRQRVSSFRPFAGYAIPLLAFSRDGRRLLTTYNTVKVWDVPSMSQLAELHPPHPTTIASATFAGDDQWIVAGVRDGLIMWTAVVPSDRPH